MAIAGKTARKRTNVWIAIAVGFLSAAGFSPAATQAADTKAVDGQAALPPVLQSPIFEESGVEPPVMAPEIVRFPAVAPYSSATAGWSAGFDFVFAQPRFSDNVGLVEHDEDLLGNSVVRPQRFEHGFEFSPRTWLAYQSAADIGLRASWWQLDAEADSLQANPPASGFGRISHPELDSVDLSSVVPAESLLAEAAIDLYTIDLEITKAARLARWDLLFAAGLRHAAYDYQYGLTLRNAAGDLAGQASFSERSSGLGPTVNVATSRTAFERLRITAGMRASLLLSESKTRLAAIEDADLATEFTTERIDDADDLLPIVETQLRAEWLGGETGYGRWLLSGGVEAQWWSGVGTASDENADLAILGLSVGTGWQW